MTIDFKKLIRDPRDVQAPPGSINAELLALPQQHEYTHDMKGLVVTLPRTGVIGTVAEDSTGGFKLVILDGTACRDSTGRETYPRGGHDISVSNLELQTAVVMDVTLPKEPVRDEALARGLGKVIWETSRADENTISVTGADIVAAAVIRALPGFGYSRSSDVAAKALEGWRPPVEIYDEGEPLTLSQDEFFAPWNEETFRKIADRVSQYENDLELDQDWNTADSVMLAFALALREGFARAAVLRVQGGQK